MAAVQERRQRLLVRVALVPLPVQDAFRPFLDCGIAVLVGHQARVEHLRVLRHAGGQALGVVGLVGPEAHLAVNRIVEEWREAACYLTVQVNP